MGYEIKVGKDISVRPPGKERFVRLCRNFGEDYAIEGIRRRILAQSRPERHIIPPDPPPKRARFIGNIHTARKVTGLRALYFYYLYRMGVLPKKREPTPKQVPSPKQVYFLFREDIRFVQKISQEARLLVKYGIDTDKQLAAHKKSVTAQMAVLINQRKHLRYQARSIRDDDKLTAVKSEIASLSENIGELRREVRLCEDIATRFTDMQNKIRIAREAEKSKGKEKSRYDPIRGRR